MKKISLHTQRPYQVLIGKNLLQKTGDLLAPLGQRFKIVLVTDSNVANLYKDQVSKSCKDRGFKVIEYILPPGEASKTMEEVTHLLNFFVTHNLTKTDLIIALGGGVIGDLAGFAASIYQRGIDFVQIPTTLLSACDSSVGGKTAVNLPGAKNMAGSFWQPSLVICDTETFKTLPKKEQASGAGECIKYAMLHDPELLDYLTRNGFDSDWTLVVEKCVIYKAQIVSMDERDQGIRTLLNFGHTLGHALESLSQYQMSHGEAVGIGMLILTRSAEKNNLCQKGTTRKLLEALEAFNLPTQTAYPAEDIALAALFDKKVSGPMINLVLPEKPGKCFIKKIPVDQLIQWIQDGTEE